MQTFDPSTVTFVTEPDESSRSLAIAELADLARDNDGRFVAAQPDASLYFQFDHESDALEFREMTTGVAARHDFDCEADARDFSRSGFWSVSVWLVSEPVGPFEAPPLRGGRS